MHLFFGLNNELFYSNIIIPKFSFKDSFFNECILCKINIVDQSWKISLLDDIENDKNFFYLKENKVKNNDIFFLATKKQIELFDKNKINDLGSFTSQKNYRASFSIFYRKSNGFSSYQSEYPFKMTKARGSVVTSTALVTNYGCKNYLLLKNIIDAPINKNFNAYIVNYKTKKIIDTFQLKTNCSNFLELTDKHIQPENYLITDKYLCIPIYISEKDGHISMEHTNPLTSNLLSEDRVELTKKFKNKIYEIIN